MKWYIFFETLKEATQVLLVLGGFLTAFNMCENEFKIFVRHQRQNIKFVKRIINK